MLLRVAPPSGKKPCYKELSEHRTYFHHIAIVRESERVWKNGKNDIREFEFVSIFHMVISMDVCKIKTIELHLDNFNISNKKSKVKRKFFESIKSCVETLSDVIVSISKR